MDLIFKISAGFLVSFLVFAYGVGVGMYRFPPGESLRTLKAFVEGDAAEESGLIDKLLNDANIRPARFIYESGLIDARSHRRMQLVGLNERRDQPMMWLAPEAPRGFRLILAAFDFNQTFWGAILIGPDGEVLRAWPLSTDDLRGSTEPSFRKNLYGAAVLPDGSIIYLMQESGGGIVRVDRCGRRLWAVEGSFHHAVSLTDEGTFWTLGGRQSDFDPVLVEISVEDGEIVNEIDMQEVRAANPHTHIFDLQRNEDVEHAVHANDVEPLHRALAGAFAQFDHRDLLVSYHTTNLVFALDPSSLEIKWWRIGAWDGQHDPDWNPDGSISVFSNNWRGVGKHSHIVSIDPLNLRSKRRVDGSPFGFYSRFNGTHQVTPGSTVMVTSATQGRVFEVDRAGDVVFEFLNVYNAAAGETLHVSDAFFFDEDYFGFLETGGWSCP